MNEETTNTEEEPKDIEKLKQAFKASYEVMKEDFKPKYDLARTRLRSEHSVKGTGNKLTHEQVNQTYSIGNAFVNSVYFKSPNCNLTAREMADEFQVENTETKVNDWLKDNKIKNTVKRVIWDAYLGGFGAVFTDYEYDDVESDEPVLDNMGQPIFNEMGEPMMKMIPTKNEIIAKRLRPDLVRFPRGFDFDNYQESPWIGFECVLPIEEIKSNEAWDQLEREKIEGKRYETVSKSGGKRDTKKSGGDDLYAKVCYCFKKGASSLEPFTLTIFHDEGTAPLEEIEFNKGHIGYPIKFLFFNPLDDDCPYPNGDPWLFESQLNAVDEWWKKLVNHVRRSNPKTAYDAGIVDSQEANKLKSNNDSEYVGIKKLKGRDIRTVLAEIQKQQMNPDLDRLYVAAREILGEIAPRANVSRGASDKGETATEARIEHSGEMIDIDARVDVVADFIKDIILDVAGMLENIAAPMQLEVETDFGMDSREVGGDGFTSKVNADIEVESMRSQNKDVMRKQLIDALSIFQTMLPFFQQLGKVPNPEFWVTKVMDTMNIRNIEDGFVDAPPMPVMPQGVPEGAPMPPPSEGVGLIPPEAPMEAEISRL